MKALKQTNRKKEGKGKEKAFVRRMKKTKNQKIEDLQNQTIKNLKIKKTKTRKKLLSQTPLSLGEWSSFVWVFIYDS